jgi:hypothetical protein
LADHWYLLLTLSSSAHLVKWVTESNRPTKIIEDRELHLQKPPRLIFQNYPKNLHNGIKIIIIQKLL